jgi:hypothetical protein
LADRRACARRVVADARIARLTATLGDRPKACCVTATRGERTPRLLR